MAPYFTKVLITCYRGGEKSPEIVCTNLPLADLVKYGKPYAYDTIHLETGNVEYYDPAKDTHPQGPICVTFESIVREVSYEERLELFKKIRERDRKHTDEAMAILLKP